MVKLIKKALTQVMGEARRTPSLIELQTFVSDAIRIVNDRPLTTISSTPGDLTRRVFWISILRRTLL